MTGDFNGDGNVDVAVSSFDNANVTVLLGLGDGSFYKAPVVTAVPSFPQGIAVGDVNGDGIPDLLAQSYSGPYQVLLGKGNGSFEAPKPVASSQSFAGPPILADVNNDGKLDLVYIFTSIQANVQLGNGDGTFRAPLTYTYTNPLASIPTIALAGMNGDGKLDLVDGYGVYVSLGNGDDTFAPAITPQVLSGASQMVFGDFNGDGHLDVLGVGGYGESYGTLDFMAGDGTGLLSIGPISAFDGFGHMVVGDWNGDHNLDIAMANGAGDTIEIALGDGHGNFQAPLRPDAGFCPAAGPVIADFTGDGKLDLAISNYDPNIAAPGVNILAGNGDGFPDILMLNKAHAKSMILLGNGDGSFEPARVSTVGTFPLNMVSADFNGDGKIDLAIGDETSNSILLLIGNGDGTFQPAVTITAAQGPVGPVAADFILGGARQLLAVDLDAD